MLFEPLREYAADVDLKLLEYQMAYPYQQSPYDYSNPASPWSVDQPLQNPPTPVQMGTPSTHSNHTISPPAYPQHLSPGSESPLPVSLLLHEPQQQPYVAPATIRLEERIPPKPNQYRFESLDPSHFEHQEHAKSPSKPARASSRVDGDEVASSTSPSSGGAGPSRVPHGRTHASTAHPYRRPPPGTPQSHAPVGTTSPLRTSAGVESRTGQAAAGRHRSVSAAPSPAARGERADRDEILPERSARPSRGVPPPGLALIKTAVPCPAINVWRVSTYNDSGDSKEQGAIGGEVDAATTSTAADSPAVPPTAPIATADMSTRARRLLISTDLWLDTVSNEVTATLELPGVKKEAVRIRLSTCPYSGVQILLVQTTTHSSIPNGAYAANERRTGQCLRTINVPSGTKREDVSASMTDGLLTIRFPGRKPIYQDHYDININ